MNSVTSGPLQEQEQELEDELELEDKLELDDPELDEDEPLDDDKEEELMIGRVQDMRSACL